MTAVQSMKRKGGEKTNKKKTQFCLQGNPENLEKNAMCAVLSYPIRKLFFSQLSQLFLLYFQIRNDGLASPNRG